MLGSQRCGEEETHVYGSNSTDSTLNQEFLVTTPSNLPHPTRRKWNIFCGWCSKTSSFLRNSKASGLLALAIVLCNTIWHQQAKELPQRPFCKLGQCSKSDVLILVLHQNAHMLLCLQVHILFSAPSLFPYSPWKKENLTHFQGFHSFLRRQFPNKYIFLAFTSHLKGKITIFF